MKKLLLLLVILPMCAWGQVIITIAGNTPVGVGNGNSLGDNGSAINAGLNQPTTVTFDINGNLYIAEELGHKVRVISPAGIITTFAGTGTSGSAGDNGLAINAQLYQPLDIAFDVASNAFIADGLNIVKKVNSATGIITTIAGSPGLGGFSGDNGPAINAQFHALCSIAVDNNGNIFLADGYNNRIRKINTSGIITTIAGGGANIPGDNGLATDAQLCGPLGVAVDNNGNIFFSESCGHRIRKINNASIITTVAGNGTAGNGGNGGLAINAQLNQPCLIHIDNSNNLFIADQNNHSIRKVAAGTGIITSVAGNGTMGFSGDGGLALNAQLHYPRGVTTDASGNIYIADLTNNRIRKVCISATMPTISISSTPAGAVCAGTQVTFTATPGSATSPSYQWIKNGSNVGTNSSTYTYTPANGDSVRCVITKTDACAGVLSASSNTINMIVNPTVTPTISIAANPAGDVCSGTSVTYTATISNGGTTPNYQWFKNGTNVGTNSATYTYIPNNNDSIRCVLTSSIACTTPVSSNTINMTVNPTVLPSVSITVAPSSTVCTGTSVTFTATPTNGGTTPAYQWQKNGLNVGTNSTTYTYIPANGDQIKCVLSSNATCATPTTATSNIITMTVSSSIVPAVSITVSPNDTLCADSLATFTATATNAGSNPMYQWKKNGANAGSNSNTYTYQPANGDSVRCVLTSNAPCAVPIQVSSNNINMVINPNVIASLTITGDTNVQTGVPTTYTAVTNLTGASYQWQVDGVNVGANSSTFIYTPATTDAVISCYITVPANSCAFPSFATTKVTVHIVTAGVSTINNVSGFNVYPNPTNNELHIDNVKSSISYQLQNIFGMSLQQGTFTQEKNTLQLQDIPAGIYLLQLTNTQGQREVVRVVKE